MAEKKEVYWSGLWDTRGKYRSLGVPCPRWVSSQVRFSWAHVWRYCPKWFYSHLGWQTKLTPYRSEKIEWQVCSVLFAELFFLFFAFRFISFYFFSFYPHPHPHPVTSLLTRDQSELCEASFSFSKLSTTVLYVIVLVLGSRWNHGLWC